jgi:hypothetical protein
MSFFSLSNIKKVLLWHKHSAYTKAEIECRLVKSSFFNIIALKRRNGVRVKMGFGCRKFPSQVMECRFYKLTHLVRHNATRRTTTIFLDLFYLQISLQLFSNWCNLFEWIERKICENWFWREMRVGKFLINYSLDDET